MEILRSTEGDIVQLYFEGDFDIPDVDDFEAHVDEAVEAQRFKLLVDGTRMRLINSTAIQALLRAQSRLKEGGGDLAVAGISPFITSVFATLGIDRRIRCFPGEAQALEWLRRGSDDEA